MSNKLHTMTPEEFEAEVKKVRAMSPEERQAWREENNIKEDSEPEVLAVPESEY